MNESQKAKLDQAKTVAKAFLWGAKKVAGKAISTVAEKTNKLVEEYKASEAAETKDESKDDSK